jgi:hypothetical protein
LRFLERLARHLINPDDMKIFIISRARRHRHDRQAQPAQIIITSPDQGRTRASGSMGSRGLHWNARDQTLTAVITDSDRDYEAPELHPHDDTLAFALPGCPLRPGK